MIEDDEIQVGQYALRTFRIDTASGELESLIQPGDWSTGTCIAVCNREFSHEPPQEECTCGVYGQLSLEALAMFGLGGQMERLVTVIAAAGTTIIGDLGLRTQAARVVAYWSPVKSVRRMCERQFQGAVHFDNLGIMLSAYDFPPSDLTEILQSAVLLGPWWLRHRAKRGIRPAIAGILFCILWSAWDMEHGVEAWSRGQWALAGFDFVMTGFMVWLGRLWSMLLIRRIRQR